MLKIEKGFFLTLVALLTFTVSYSMDKRLHLGRMEGLMAALCTGVHASGEKCPDTDACKTHYGNGVCKYWADVNDKGEITSQGCACYKGGTMAEIDEVEFAF